MTIDDVPTNSPSAAPTGVSEARLRLLTVLHRSRSVGCTAEELAGALSVTRNAVQQQLTGLERDGLVEVKELRSTGGRPSRAFTLTDDGLELFPRQYAWLSEALLKHVELLFGDDGLTRLFESMSDEFVASVQPRLEGKSDEERSEEVAAILKELGYGSFLDAQGNLRATNCVFHKVAMGSAAICRYDALLLGKLLGHEADQLSCIREGRSACVFSSEHH